MTVTEAAQRLDLSPASVRRELASGRLRCCRVGPGGRRIHVTEEHIQEYLRKCESGPATVAVGRAAPGIPDFLAEWEARKGKRT